MKTKSLKEKALDVFSTVALIILALAMLGYFGIMAYELIIML